MDLWEKTIIQDHYVAPNYLIYNRMFGGHLGGSVGWASDFDSGHNLIVHGFEPHIGLCADSLQPGACFGFSLSVCPSVSLSLSLPHTLSKINKH